MDDAQAAQRFNQVQLSRVEGPKRCIAFEKGFELWFLLLAIPGQEHPEILHGRAVPTIVQIYDM